MVNLFWIDLFLSLFSFSYVSKRFHSIINLIQSWDKN
ncbi:F-box protein [Chryseobacterium indoltheticum]